MRWDSAAWDSAAWDSAAGFGGLGFGGEEFAEESEETCSPRLEDLARNSIAGGSRRSLIVSMRTSCREMRS